MIVEFEFRDRCIAANYYHYYQKDDDVCVKLYGCEKVWFDNGRLCIQTQYSTFNYNTSDIISSSLKIKRDINVK